MFILIYLLININLRLLRENIFKGDKLFPSAGLGSSRMDLGWNQSGDSHFTLSIFCCKIKVFFYLKNKT